MRKLHYKLCALSKIYNTAYSTLFYLICFKSTLSVVGFAYDWVKYLLFPPVDGTTVIIYSSSLIVLEYFQVILWAMTCSTTAAEVNIHTHCFILYEEIIFHRQKTRQIVFKC